MAEYEQRSNKITAKMVYYGPALSGKTTNLVCLHDILKPELKGEIMELDTKNDRTLFFDLLPLGITAPTGLLIKFKLFTVPGQVKHDSTRKAVLSRADGVVFVADSQLNQSMNNAESFENLAENVARLGLDFESLPLVVQFNKRDLANIQTEEQVLAKWNTTSWPIRFSSALHGEGVIETLTALLQQSYRRLNNEFGLLQDHDLDMNHFIDSVVHGRV